MSASSSSTSLKGLKMTRGKAAATAAAVVGTVGLYEAYRRGWFTKTSDAVKKIVDSAQDAAETLGTLCKDTKEFLSSDSEVVPQSLRQALKLASCEETKEVVQTHVQATIKGVLESQRSTDNETSVGGRGENESEASTSGSDNENTEDGFNNNKRLRKSSSNSMLSQTLEKIFSKKGSGFFSIIAASLAKQTITTLMENASEQTSDGEAFEKYKDILMSEEGKQFVSDLLVTLVVEATSVYTDKTIHINYYDQILESAIKPQHRSFVENLCVKLCKAWTETVMTPQQAPPPSHLEQAKTNGHSIPLEETLCTPRDYPELISQDSNIGCESPNSVCSGLKSSSTASSHQQHLAVARPNPSSGGNTNVKLVKDILSTAASDAEVRSFLVNVASSSSAATARVFLEAFVPSWLLMNGFSGKTTAGHKNHKNTNGHTTQQFVFYVCGVLILLVSAMWMKYYKPSHVNLNGHGLAAHLTETEAETGSITTENFWFYRN